VSGRNDQFEQQGSGTFSLEANDIDQYNNFSQSDGKGCGHSINLDCGTLYIRIPHETENPKFLVLHRVESTMSSARSSR
jgi:hypothetical protein